MQITMREVNQKTPIFAWFLEVSNRPFEMMYIFGSVRFRISEDTTFQIVNGELVVDGHIKIFDDNFNHESSSLPKWLSAGSIHRISSHDFLTVLVHNVDSCLYKT